MGNEADSHFLPELEVRQSDFPVVSSGATVGCQSIHSRVISSSLLLFLFSIHSTWAAKRNSKKDQATQTWKQHKTGSCTTEWTSHSFGSLCLSPRTHYSSVATKSSEHSPTRMLASHVHVTCQRKRCGFFRTNPSRIITLGSKEQSYICAHELNSAGNRHNVSPEFHPPTPGSVTRPSPPLSITSYIPPSRRSPCSAAKMARINSPSSNSRSFGNTSRQTAEFWDGVLQAERLRDGGRTDRSSRTPLFLVGLYQTASHLQSGRQTVFNLPSTKRKRGSD